MFLKGHSGCCVDNSFDRKTRQALSPEGEDRPGCGPSKGPESGGEGRERNGDRGW